MKANQIRKIYYYLELKFRRKDPLVLFTDIGRDVGIGNDDVELIVESLVAARVIKKVVKENDKIPELQMDLNFKSLRRMI